MQRALSFAFFFFFNDTATTEIYPLSLHDALPISPSGDFVWGRPVPSFKDALPGDVLQFPDAELEDVAGKRVLERRRSEEHTSELQSHLNLVCRLLLDKKKINNTAQVNPRVPHCC